MQVGMNGEDVYDKKDKNDDVSEDVQYLGDEETKTAASTTLQYFWIELYSFVKQQSLVLCRRVNIRVSCQSMWSEDVVSVGGKSMWLEWVIVRQSEWVGKARVK